jgi:hypothetical protein
MIDRKDCISRAEKNEALAKESDSMGIPGAAKMADDYRHIAALYRKAIETDSMEIFQEAYALEEGGDPSGTESRVPKA